MRIEVLIKILLIASLVFATDIAAFCLGSSWVEHQLPSTALGGSKKTWPEGQKITKAKGSKKMNLTKHLMVMPHIFTVDENFEAYTFEPEQFNALLGVLRLGAAYCKYLVLDFNQILTRSNCLKIVFQADLTRIIDVRHRIIIPTAVVKKELSPLWNQYKTPVTLDIGDCYGHPFCRFNIKYSTHDTSGFYAGFIQPPEPPMCNRSMTQRELLQTVQINELIAEIDIDADLNRRIKNWMEDVLAWGITLRFMDQDNHNIENFMMSMQFEEPISRRELRMRARLTEHFRPEHARFIFGISLSALLAPLKGKQLQIFNNNSGDNFVIKVTGYKNGVPITLWTMSRLTEITGIAFLDNPVNAQYV